MDERLHKAVMKGNLGAIRRFLASGVMPDSPDSEGQTSLLIAARLNKIEAARLLIEAGADVNAMDFFGDSPFLNAASNGHLEILTMALGNGADLANEGRCGGNALFRACEGRHVSAIQALIDAGVNLDSLDKYLRTALTATVLSMSGGPRRVAIVRVLVEGGAAVNIKDAHGDSPLTHARRRGFTEIEQILVAAGARD